MRFASELGISLVCLLIAVALVWLGRQNSHSRFMQNGLVFVSYPAVVLVFVAIGTATFLSAVLR